MTNIRMTLGIAIFTAMMLCGTANFAESKAKITEAQIKNREWFRKNNEKVRVEEMHKEEAAKRAEWAKDKHSGTKSREEAVARMQLLRDRANLRLEEVKRRHDERRKSVFNEELPKNPEVED